MHVGVGMGICDSGEWMGPRNFWRQLYYLNGSNLTFADMLTYTWLSQDPTRTVFESGSTAKQERGWGR